MNWQLAAVAIIVAGAAAAFIRMVFFPKKHGCGNCGGSSGCSQSYHCEKCREENERK